MAFSASAFRQFARYVDEVGHIGGGSPHPMFSARTGFRKGNIDETGSWVFSVSVFNTLSSGD